MKSKHLFTLILLPLLALTACTSVQVRPVPASTKMDAVVIRKNPKVTMSEFLPVLQAGFARHGIASQVITPEMSAPGQFLVTYNALRSWDVVTYLSHASVTIEKDGRIVGHAEYHLKGKGGLAPTKFKSTEAKMAPVMDRLLGEVSRR